MATTVVNGSGFLTLKDHLSRLDPDGSIADIVETMSIETAVVGDAIFMESNLPTGHRFTSRTALPAIGRRRFGEGVAPTKSGTAQVTESMTMLEANSAVDVDEAELNGDEAEYRASEDASFVESMTQQAEEEFLYGNAAADPSDMTGLIPRFMSTSAVGGKQIVLHDAAASGNDQTTLALVGWGPKSVFGIFPKGTKAGLTPRDMGRQLWDPNGDGKKFLAWVTNWNWKMGLVVKDYRRVAMIRNIDVGNLLTNGASSDALIQSSISAYYKIWKPAGVRLAWYGNRIIAEYLHKQALNSVKNSTLRIDEVGGVPVTKLLGIPVNVSDAITSTEAPIA